MNCTLSKILIFAVGAAVGSAVSWKFLKEKYERIAQDEIDSMKEYLSRKNKKQEEEQAHAKEMKELESTITDCGYSSKFEKKTEVTEPMKKNGPRIISPDEYGECDYETLSYTYYANDILTDEYGEVVDDLAGTVGEDFHEHFGDYETDSVFVRNDELGIDYEILRDLSEYVPDVEG